MELEQPAASPESAETLAAPATADSPAPGNDPAAPVDENQELLNLLPAEDGLEEIEHEGIKAKVPKELKDAFLRQQDYTRKTQEVAEQRKVIEARAAEVQRAAQFQQAHIADVARITAIDEQLAEYRKLPWPTLIAQNPQQAALLDHQMRELETHRGQLANGLAEKHRQQTLNEQQVSARRIQEGQQELARDIKGWSPQLGTEVAEYASKLGIPRELLTPATPPAFIKMAHKAMQWDRLIAQRNAKPAAQPAKPATRVNAGSSSPPSGLNDNLSADEWLKRRTAQLEQRKKR